MGDNTTFQMRMVRVTYFPHYLQGQLNISSSKCTLGTGADYI